MNCDYPWIINSLLFYFSFHVEIIIPFFFNHSNATCMKETIYTTYLIFLREKYGMLHQHYLASSQTMFVGTAETIMKEEPLGGDVSWGRRGCTLVTNSPHMQFYFYFHSIIFCIEMLCSKHVGPGLLC